VLSSWWVIAESFFGGFRHFQETLDDLPLQIDRHYGSDLSSLRSLRSGP
jgi:hypothetical protein